MNFKQCNILFKKYRVYIPAVLFLIPFFFQKKELHLFPDAKKYNLIPYTDHNDSGENTSASVFYGNDSTILFNYALKKSDISSGKDPYAGFAIDLVNKKKFFDISYYDIMNVDLSIRHGNSFIINLKTVVDGFTILNDWHTYYVESVQIPVHFGSINYRIKLIDLKVPQWWWKEVGPAASNLPKEANRRKLLGIDFQNGSGVITNVNDTMTITRLSFSKDYQLLNILMLAGFFSYIVFVYIVLQITSKKRNSNKDADISYKKLDIGNTLTEESARIAHYLGGQFHDPELTLEKIARKVGIGAPRISTILQKAYNLTFKQYLNQIRVTEAERLLKETDRSITEIGFAVGYNNITHFNRVFKQNTDRSPTEFRNQLIDEE